ncbi:MAG: hypothetical protein QM744_02480 [Mesorhizobium sp.]
MTGISTDCCVDSTARSGVPPRLSCLRRLGCLRCFEDDLHSARSSVLRKNLVLVTSSGDRGVVCEAVAVTFVAPMSMRSPAST